MPGGDGTGPAGMGPMTGRSAGYCAGYPSPGAVNPGPGRGYGFGFRGGRGRRWAGGPYAGGYGYNIPYAPPYAASPTRQQEIEALQGRARYLEKELKDIQKRISALGAEETKE